MIALFLFFLLIGIVCIGVGIYQKKTYFDRQTMQSAQVTGYVKYENNAHGIPGLAIDAMSSAAGLKHPVVDVTLPDGALQTVRLNITVNDDIIEKYPEFDVGGRVDVLYFGNDPKIAYLMNHPMSQTVVKTGAPMIIGIVLTVFSFLLIGADIYYTLTL